MVRKRTVINVNLYMLCQTKLRFYLTDRTRDFIILAIAFDKGVSIMSKEKILTVQDISCVGQCSLTVALPVISACGIETCVLPTAVLSTHTAFKPGWTFRDLTCDIQPISEHWSKENITFKAIYTGYLGSREQVDLILKLIDRHLEKDGATIVDPAMADGGVLYKGFPEDFPKDMARLCAVADVILPNITEACLMTGTAFRTEYDEKYILDLLSKLSELGCKKVVLTGVSFDPKKLGVAVYDCKNKKVEYYFNDKLPRMSHGTGDVYASAFVGAYMNGKSVYESASIAADFTVRTIEATMDDESHWYGVKFEKELPYLIERLK